MRRRARFFAKAAQSDGRFLITQDLDFSDAREYVPGTHHGLLRVRPVALQSDPPIEHPLE